MSTIVKGKIVRMDDVRTRTGRMGDYRTQGVMLKPEEKQTVYGTFFEQAIDVAKSQGLRSGDTIEVELVFTTSERNQFVTNYVEFVNPRKV